MGSPAYFAKLANFEASSRKAALIPFGLFNVADNLNFIASVDSGSQLNQSTMAFSTTPAIDSSLADVISMTLTANVASMTFTYAGSGSIPTGQRFWLRLVQNATGGWTVALPTNLITDIGVTVDPGPLRATVFPVQWNGSSWIFFAPVFSVPLA